jgi:predicted Zn-dependent peptidase
MPRGQATRVVRPPPRPHAGVVAEVTDPADPVTTVRIGFAAPARGRPALRRLIARIVDERMQRLREALGAAYAVHVAYAGGRGASAIVITARVDAARSGEALHMMIEELEVLRAGDRDLAEAFVRARRQLLMTTVAELSGAARSADRIASLIASGEDVGANARLAREVMDLTMNDARSALASELADERAVIALIGAPDSVAAARRALDEVRSGVSPRTR